jgi:cation:H+ antiporter
MTESTQCDRPAELMIDFAALTAGLIVLIAGGELFVRGAATTAGRFGVPPLLIGLTLVGFGTSMPELVTSVEASLLGSPGIAIGNIVGSNIANILLILGIAATISPISVRQNALRRDGVFVLATAAAFWAIGLSLPLNRLVGSAFLTGLAAYLYYAYRQEMAGAPEGHTAAFGKMEAHDELPDGDVTHTASPPAMPPGTRLAKAAAWVGPLVMAIGGLIAVILGGKLLVDGAIGVAGSAGISEPVIGLTIVAIGTSLPELVTSIIAALRGHGDIALGNVLGSNIYNILGIGGITAVIAPTLIPPQIVHFDSLIMVGVSVLLLVVARTGNCVSRGEGTAMFLGYSAYLYAIWSA